MWHSFVPSILTPSYTWPAPRVATIQRTTPPVPAAPGVLSKRLWGKVHKLLYHLSEWYSWLFGIYSGPGHIFELPFGLVMKWTDWTSVEEAIATQMVRTAGIPAPRVLCLGEFNSPWGARWTSILMTRLPGIELNNRGELLDVEDEEPWLGELKTCLHAIREREPPSQDVICSPLGTALRSTRVPEHIMGPFKDHKSFYDHLFAPSSQHGFKSIAESTKQCRPQSV